MMECSSPPDDLGEFLDTDLVEAQVAAAVQKRSSPIKIRINSSPEKRNPEQPKELLPKDNETQQQQREHQPFLRPSSQLPQQQQPPQLSQQQQLADLPADNPLLSIFGINLPKSTLDSMNKSKDQDDLKSVIEIRNDIFQRPGFRSEVVRPNETPYVVFDNRDEDRRIESSPNDHNRPRVDHESELSRSSFMNQSNPHELIEPPEIKVEVAEKGLLRCSFCPSPSAISLQDKFVHMEFHTEHMFACAACPKRREFEDFGQIVTHINISHNVNDFSMVLETIMLPQAEGSLRLFKCGVKNCGKEFIGLPEAELKNHMKSAHGDYYIKVGKGKYVLRLCRICGDAESFSTLAELDLHISTSHPIEHFGNLAEFEEEELDDEQAGTLTDNLLSSLRNPREEVAAPEVPMFGKSMDQSETVKSPMYGQKSGTPEAQPSPVFGKSMPAEKPAIAESLPVFGKPMQEGSEDLSKLLKKKLKHEPEEGEVLDSEEETSHKKKKNKKKNMKKKSYPANVSEEDSESEFEDERKTAKKQMKVKKEKLDSPKDETMSLEDKVATLNPKQLKRYLKQLEKIKADHEKKKLKDHLAKRLKDVKKPAAVTEYPKMIKDKKAFYYCLICSQNVGVLKKWNIHKRTQYHMESFDTANEEAKQKYNCQDIDLQECAITTKKKLKGTVVGQCRDCSKVFKNDTDCPEHLQTGVCPDKDKLVVSSDESVKDIEDDRRKESRKSRSRETKMRRNQKEDKSSSPRRVSRRRSNSPESSERIITMVQDEDVRKVRKLLELLTVMQEEKRLKDIEATSLDLYIKHLLFLGQNIC